MTTQTKSNTSSILLTTSLLLQQGVIFVIRLYQKTVSPDHGALARNPFLGCRYTPSCSEYTIRSIKKYGVFRGLLKGSWRILRCNPFSRGGVDDVR